MIRLLAQTVVEQAGAKGLLVATAESCTGGMVAAALTDVPGSSAVVECGFVTYSNDAKSEMLDVPARLIAEHGAVSQRVARAMAQGAIAKSRADIAVSITGIAGPTGGSAQKPLGLVWFALAERNGPTRTERRVFAGGSRALVRLKATEAALGMLAAAIARQGSTRWSDLRPSGNRLGARKRDKAKT